jgi:YVTN family beta-propeller protein
MDVSSTHRGQPLVGYLRLLGIAAWLGVGAAYATPFAYISNINSNNVSVIDTASNAVVTTVTVGTQPFGVAVNPAGTFAYVANEGSNTISVINTATNAVVATVTVGKDPIGVAVHPLGTFVYVANDGASTVSVNASSRSTAKVRASNERRPRAGAGKGSDFRRKYRACNPVA